MVLITKSSDQTRQSGHTRVCMRMLVPFTLCLIGYQPYPVINAVVNPGRDLLGRKILEQHVTSSNDSVKTKIRQKRQQKGGRV